MIFKFLNNWKLKLNNLTPLNPLLIAIRDEFISFKTENSQKEKNFQLLIEDKWHYDRHAAIIKS